MESQIIKHSIEKIIYSIEEVIAIYAFGSFGSEYQTASSDLDLALIAREKQNPVFLWELAQSIASDFNMNVEIIDMLQASTVFKYQIITEGRRVWCSDETKCDALENTYASMYLRLNEERKDIIQDNRTRNG